MSAHEAEPSYEESLLGASLLFGFLGTALSSEPSEEILKPFFDENLLAELPYANDDPQVGEGLEYLKAWQKQSAEQNVEDVLQNLKTDWFQSFVGAGKPLASPWESSYTDRELIIFGEDTFKVRAWYKKYGLRVEKYNNEPDDHIGIMLSFLAFLATQESQKLSEEDSDAAQQLQADQREFIAQHILSFLPSWIDLVVSKSNSNFYIGIALLAQGAINTRVAQLESKA